MLIENLFVGANEALRNAPSLRARPGRSPVAVAKLIALCRAPSLVLVLCVMAGAGVCGVVLTAGMVGVDRAPIVDRAERAVEDAKELAEREARYRLLADSATDIIMLKRPNGERSYVSPACRSMLGYEPDEFLAIPSAMFVHPDDYERLRLLNQGISPANPQFTSVHRLRHKNGCYLWVEAAFRLTETSLGEPIILGAIRDVSERHRQSEELKAAKAAADEANAAKTDFLATMSHEIRTPLNGILGYTELLLDDASLTPKQRRSLERLESAGAALLTSSTTYWTFPKSRLERSNSTIAPSIPGSSSTAQPPSCESWRRRRGCRSMSDGGTDPPWFAATPTGCGRSCSIS
jgi:PAS domain S-box-containing protein